MKEPPKWRQFTDHPYPVQIFATGTEAQFRRLRSSYNRRDVPGPEARNAAGLTFVWYEPGVQPIIVVALGKMGRFALQTLAHESVHVVQAIEERIEQRLDAETEAYMVGALTEWLAGVYLRSGGEIPL